MDVDGVLTDNQIYISSDKTETKSFCIDDGTGAAIARFAKLHLGLLEIDLVNRELLTAVLVQSVDLGA